MIFRVCVYTLHTSYIQEFSSGTNKVSVSNLYILLAALDACIRKICESLFTQLYTRQINIRIRSPFYSLTLGNHENFIPS